ncbi:ficolin-2-like [Physella acuta]|uniref:ficolin-2-like n=1 Tax=Physella acuta TaxID=109671 RepID=UPI0027DB3400|nr:ficolin-2-like [Physella acuta]
MWIVIVIIAQCIITKGSWLVPLKASQQNVEGKLFSSGKICNTTRNITVMSDGSITRTDIMICTGDATLIQIISSDHRPLVTLSSGLQVMCDTVTDGGGWTIFQRRVSGTVDFYRNWTEYKNGFGDFSSGNFYLGNENIFLLTSKTKTELRVDMTFNGTTYQNGMMFSTFDRDNDIHTGLNCADYFHGAWWFSNCGDSCLNNVWGTTNVKWNPKTNPTFIEMKFRLV